MRSSTETKIMTSSTRWSCRSRIDSFRLARSILRPTVEKPKTIGQWFMNVQDFLHCSCLYPRLYPRPSIHYGSCSEEKEDSVIILELRIRNTQRRKPKSIIRFTLVRFRLPQRCSITTSWTCSDPLLNYRLSISPPFLKRLSGQMNQYSE